MQYLFDQFVAKAKTGTTQDEISDLARLQEEQTTARRCIDICSKAEDHLKETISVIDNYATRDDTVQFLVSTSDKIIHGKTESTAFELDKSEGTLVISRFNSYRETF